MRSDQVFLLQRWRVSCWIVLAAGVVLLGVTSGFSQNDVIRAVPRAVVAPIAVQPNAASAAGANVNNIADILHVEGRVVDENGRAVENARVQSFGPAVDCDKTSTDATGRFRFTWHNQQFMSERFPYDRLVLVKDASEDRQGWQGLENTDTLNPITIRLTPAQTIKVNVADDDGKPVAGA